jgi:replicative DNA helicase
MTTQRKPWRPAVEVVDLGGRVPPHNDAVEAAVLAHVLAHGGTALDELADLLGVQHWYADGNRRVYAAAVELHREGRAVDLQTVAERLRARDEIQAIGGVSFLATLIDSTPAVANLRAHAEIVVDLATKRRAIDTCQLAAAEGFGDTGPTLAWLDGVEQKIHDLAPARQTRGVVDAYDLMSDFVRRMGDPTPPGISTGLVDVDRQLGGGMRDGELIIVAARPGMGKTAFVTGLLMSVASAGPLYDGADMVRPNLGAMLFSLEMPAQQMGDRIACSDARVSLSALRSKSLTPNAADSLTESASKLSQLPLWVDDTPAITMMELRAKARRKQREFDKAGQKLALVIVDYLQLMKGSGEDNREQEISSISRGLKQMAKELKLPVVALSQLNRAVETRSTKDKRPQLSDLRESGAIEQDADVILFVYRPEYYISDKTSADAHKLAGYAEIIFAKQRNGPTGRVPVTFVESCARFENRSRDSYSDSDE